MSKGIYQQILESASQPVKPLKGKELLEQLEKHIEDATIRNKEEFKRRDKISKNNMKHLIKRSKELNKEIPLPLIYVLCSTNVHYVGSAFTNHYKEWLDE